MDLIERLYFQIGEKIRTGRERSQLTQEDLARKVGLTRTSITNIEKGQQRVQVHTLYTIAEFLDISIYELLPLNSLNKPSNFSKLLPKDILPQEREWVANILQFNSNDKKKKFERILDLATNFDPLIFLTNAKVKEAPVPVERIASLYGIHLRYMPFKGSMAGLAYAAQDMKVIGINSNHETPKQRFIIAHELGHLVQFRNEGHDDPRLQLDRNTSPLRYKNIDKHAYANEVNVNDFASKLLIPFGMLKDDLGNKDIEPENEEMIARLASKYEVPPPVIYYRLIKVIDEGLKE
ncbi:MAG TPA: ImmA/IrrE family metallo-endopeptidase [Pyrinomonadaceae bacterium]|nr:ImmA/IrrE family metallo-endopeptidase [Pyrinomonadaceae bacterium]